MNATIRITELGSTIFKLTDYANENQSHIPFTGYEFFFNSEIKLNEQDKSISCNFFVKLFEKIDQHQKNELGEVTTYSSYQITNYDDVIKKGEDDKVTIPDKLIQLINNLSIQHTRGILSARLDGTRYSNAILPLINPSTMYNKKPES